MPIPHSVCAAIQNPKSYVFLYLHHKNQWLIVNAREPEVHDYLIRILFYRKLWVLVGSLIRAPFYETPGESMKRATSFGNSLVSIGFVM